MEFKIPYLLAMRDQAPKMFNRLRRTGAMDAHLQAKSVEAHRMYEELAKGKPKLPNGGLRSVSDSHQIEELVFAALIEFPQDQLDPAHQSPEPNLDEIGTTL
jgi:hypothetical protein